MIKQANIKVKRAHRRVPLGIPMQYSHKSHAIWNEVKWRLSDQHQSSTACLWFVYSQFKFSFEWGILRPPAGVDSYFPSSRCRCACLLAVVLHCVRAQLDPYAGNVKVNHGCLLDLDRLRLRQTLLSSSYTFCNVQLNEISLLWA